MKTSQVVFLLVIFLFIGLNAGFAQVTIDPVGVAVFTEDGDSTVVEVTLTNDSDNDMFFALDFDDPPDENARNAGPRRDDPGEVIDEFRMDGFSQGNRGGSWAKDWDTGIMWWSCYEGLVNVIDGENEYELVDTFRPGGNCGDIAILNGIIYITEYNTANCWRYDQDFERLENIQFDWVTRGIAADPELEVLLVIQSGGNYPIHVYEVDGDELGEEVGVIDNHGQYQDNLYAWQFAWAPAHTEGEMWLQVPSDRANENIMQIDIDTEEWEAVDQTQAFRSPDASSNWLDGIGHDGYNIWVGTNQTDVMKVVDDGIEESYHKWLVVDMEDEEGIIEANSSTSFNLIFQPIDIENSVYEIYMLVELYENEARDAMSDCLTISAIMSYNSPTFNVSGIVKDVGNDNPIEDAKLDVSGHYFARFTDENGEYSAENMPLGDYEVTISATDFLTTIDDVNIEEAGDFDWDIGLLHSECTPSQRQFFMQLEPDYTYEFEFQVDNGGNGPLTYAVDRRLLGDANSEPFELRRTNEIEDVTGDDMLSGTVFVDGNFYVSGGNNGDNPNKIYVLNIDGEVINEFNQFVEDRYGMRDLAYDGELIWGAVEGTFYGFTTAGELEIEFSVDANVEGRALAWDPVDEVLLASDISTDIFAINRDGNVVETYNRPAELRIYGLGVWPDDPEGYYLYVFCRGPDNVGIDAFKLNPATGEYMLAAYFDVGDGRPGGIQITNQLDVYSWVIVSLVQNPDRLNVWQLAARKEWFQITPTAGVIEPDDYEEFVLTLDATGLPTDNDFCGEVVFMHDGIGQETVLDVTLSVVEGRVQTTRDINLHIGWNAISTNLQPNDNENIEGLVDSIVTTGAMIMMKNTNGDFYRPAYDFNNIQAWNSWEGFQMLMAEAATLTIAGESVLKEDPIDLTSGWQLISYYPRYEIEATEALASIVDHLIIAKDGYGNFYLPEWDNFSNMGYMCEGQGYFIKVDADCRLVYVPEEEEERRASVISSKSVYDKPGQLPVHAVTGENMSLLVTTETSLEGEVGVYAGGELVGSGVIQNGVCGIAVWGDDLSTETIDGAILGDALEIKLLTDSGLQNASYTILSGKLTYESDGLAIIRLSSASELPLEFGIVSAYPNPFNSQMRVSFNLLETGVVDFAAYDVSGRRVAELSSGRQVSGVHTVMFDGKDMPSGVYMLRLQANGQSSMMKVMLVK